jgi:hypothetical protein
MHHLKRDITVDTYPSPFTGPGSFESQEGVILPWETGSALVITGPAVPASRDPRAAVFWLLTPPFRYGPQTPIRHALSVSAEEQKVRDILRANISKLMLEDTYRSMVRELEIAADREKSSKRRTIEVFFSWTTTEPSAMSRMLEYPLNEPRTLNWISTQDDPVSPGWIQTVLRDGRQSTSTASFMKLVDALEDALAQSDFETIDKVLIHLDYSQISPEAMVALLRTTYQARSSLQAWSAAVQKIKDELNRRGVDGQRVLAGLLS